MANVSRVISSRAAQHTSNSNAARITYRSGTSLLHRLHPLVKLAWLVWGTLFVFLVQSPLAVLGVLALIFIGFSASKLRLQEVRGRRLFFVTTLGLIFVQIMFYYHIIVNAYIQT